MKGAGTLASLVAAAVIAGLLLSLLKQRRTGDQEKDAAPTGIQQYVEDTVGLRFKSAPEIRRVAREVLLGAVGDTLTAQFGPGGLERRARALELLGFHEFAARSMRESLVGLHTIGVRGWLDEKGGRLLVPADFDESKIEDRVILHGLLAHLLIHQHSPKVIGRPGDDEQMAQAGLRAAIAESIKARLRTEHREQFELPTSLVTEREALLSTLPIYLAALGELPQERGAARVYLETRLRTRERTLPDLIENPPRSTFELLRGNADRLRPPLLPAPGPGEEAQLEESLGALQLQTLVEWLESYEQAQVLALLWRGDRYRLFANASGDHLLWICQWETEAAARKAAEILSRRQDPPDTAKRAFSVTAQGKITVLANCAEAETLRSVQEQDFQDLQ